MKKNLSKRLFLITLSLLVVLIGSIFIIQGVIFQKFYQIKKTDSLINEVTKFRQFYAYNNPSDPVFIGSLKNFEIKNTCTLGIFSPGGDPVYVSSSIKYNDVANNDFNKLLKSINNNQDLLYSVLQDGNIETLPINSSLAGDKKIGVISYFKLYNTTDALLIVMSSVTPIQEASNALNEFFIYVFIGVIFISIILASIYSNTISKPLVKLNSVAKRMSNMDFRESCKVDREDEIGNLARTLNFLSINLQKALFDLRLKNEKLQRDIEKERTVEILRKDFIASVSHDLKTPIGIIEGYAEGLKDGVATGEDAKFYLDTIIDETQKMEKLVNNMLELSKLESGTVKPTLEVFNINRLINKIAVTHKNECSEKGLLLSFEPNTEYSYVYADVLQMEQVMTNLITNAIKYTPEGEKIVISIDEENNQYKISITNYGINIPNCEIEKLFHKFYTLDKSRNSNSRSTGLGLSIVKNILDLHNSHYELNNIDNGVQFFFLLNKSDFTVEDFHISE